MILRGILLGSPSFIFEGNIFYQTDLPRKGAFEKNYIELREIEKRVYSDEVARNLPDFKQTQTLKGEWSVRKITMNNLITYFKRKENKVILELGCGNGWLSHQLAISLKAEILALDINETELLQGASLFKNCQNLSFMRADVFTVDLKQTFDTILLASCIQYFPNFKKLIDRLLELLTPSGEIHIVDSPIYPSSTKAKEAKKRSDDYFKARGIPEMAHKYFHHSILEPKKFNCHILAKPNYLISLFKRKILGIPQNEFPWILIKHS